MNYFNKVIFLAITLGLSTNSLVWAMDATKQEEAPAATEPEAEIDQFGTDQAGWSALHKAVFNADHETVISKIHNGSNPNAVAFVNGQLSMLTPLLIAARLGSAGMVYLLLSLGADVNFAPGGLTALHIAAYYGYDLVVEILLEHNANATLKTTANLVAFNNFMAFELVPNNHPMLKQRLMFAAYVTTPPCA